MLVLTRKLDERIVIGGGIEVVICDIRPDRVRIGIVAPRNVAVHREEVQQLIDRQPSSGGGGNGSNRKSVRPGG